MLFKKNKFIAIFLFAFFANCLELYSQLIKNQSIEIEIVENSSRPEYSVYPIKSGGFILQERLDPIFGKKQNIWLTKKYSNDLVLVWSREIEIPDELNFNVECLTKNVLYMNFTKSNSTKIKLIRIDLEKGDYDWIEGDLIGIQDIYDMRVVENSAFFSGRFQGRAVVMGLFFFDNTIKALNGLYSNHTEVIEIDADEDKKELHIYTKNRYKSKCELQLRIYDQDGIALSTTNIENDSKKIPFNGRMNNTEKNESLVIGNYARYCDNFSQGIYVKKMGENSNSKTKFIDFSEFNNFFNYLNPKRQKKVQDKLSKRKQAGKDLKFNYSMLVHKLYNFNDQLVMVAEIYYTEARSAASLPFYLNSKDYTPFSYRFTHTIICGFDKEGNKLWDNCLPMKSLSSLYLNEQVQLSQLDNKLILAYPETGKIKTQVIEENKTIRELEVYEVIPKEKSFWDEESSSGLSAWHGQNFLYWGIKSAGNEGDLNPKKVFFVNKLSYQL
jgi:hypothetical protein